MFQVLRLYEYQEPRCGLCSVCVKVRVPYGPMVRPRSLCIRLGFLGFHRKQPPTYSCNESKHRDGPNFAEKGPHSYANGGLVKPGHFVSGRLVARLDTPQGRLGGVTSACFDAVVSSYDPQRRKVQLTEIHFRSSGNSKGLRVPHEFDPGELSWNPNKG